MIVKKYLDVNPIQEMPGVLKREVVNAGDGAPNYIMRVFDVDPGSATPFHTHAWEHEVYVLSGEGVAVDEKGETKISKDSVVFVPSEEKHCFKNNGRETLQFICVIPYQK
jgi:quercetin dioxygenase-like cupin family protein